MGQLEVNRVHFELPLPSNQPLMAAGNDADAAVFAPILFSFASSSTDKPASFPPTFARSASVEPTALSASTSISSVLAEALQPPPHPPILRAPHHTITRPRTRSPSQTNTATRLLLTLVDHTAH